MAGALFASHWSNVSGLTVLSVIFRSDYLVYLLWFQAIAVTVISSLKIGIKNIGTYRYVCKYKQLQNKLTLHYA